MNKLTKAEDLNFLKIKSCVLKVNIHCEGCKKKVKKLLQKIDGVYTTSIDAEQGKVTITGNVDSSTIIKKLRKSGKHAELWISKNNTTHNSHYLLPKLPVDTPKGQKIPSNNSPVLKNPLVNSTKGEKSVKFSVPVEEFDDGSEFGDSLDDEDDYFDETDASDDEINGFGGDVKAMNPAKKGFFEAKNGSQKGNDNGDGDNNGRKEGKGGGLAGILTAAGAAAAEAPVSGGALNFYQQQGMRLMNENSVAYGYPTPDSNSYTSYFSDENTVGNCVIM